MKVEKNFPAIGICIFTEKLYVNSISRWFYGNNELFIRQAPSHYLADIIGQGPGPGYAM